MGSRPEWREDTRVSKNWGQSSSALRSSSSSSSQSSSSTKRDQARMMEFIHEPPHSLLNDGDPLAPLDVETMNLLQCIVQAADGRKAQDISALKVHHVSTLTSVLVIVSGNSRPQNQAIAAAIAKDVADQFGGQRPGGSGTPEGSAESGWMLLDYGTVMVHIMTPKSRLFYNVEGQWLAKGARDMEIQHWLVGGPEAPLSPGTTTTKDGSSSSLASPSPPPPQDQDDPFWS